MTVLNQESVIVTSAMTDAFGTSAPTNEVGLIKEVTQTGFFVFMLESCVIYLKDPSGVWNQYAGITVTQERSLTIPWGDNTAVFFECANPSAVFRVHRKTGNILYDSTPEDDTDDNFTLQAGGNSVQIATASSAYDLPDADGTDGQVLTSDGAGDVGWEDIPPTSGLVISTDDDLTLDSSHNGATIIVYQTNNGQMKRIDLPPMVANTKVEFIFPHNFNGAWRIMSHSSTEHMVGLIGRLVAGADSSWDTAPESFSSVVPVYMPGSGHPDSQASNTVTIDYYTAGSKISFHTDGNYWFITGLVMSGTNPESNVYFSELVY